MTTTAPFMLGRLASTVTGGATARPGAGFYLGPARWICPAQSNVAHNLVSVGKLAATELQDLACRVSRLAVSFPLVTFWYKAFITDPFYRCLQSIVNNKKP